MTELGRNVGFSGQCFPVRSLTRDNAVDNGNSGGAWLVAYKAEQRRRFKAVLCREPDVALPGKTSESIQKLSKTKNSDGLETRRKLDGIYLMNAFYINDPLDLCSINISGKGLTLVNEDDFSMFRNVIHIDAGDNKLELMNFRRFPNLKTLELPLNNICGTVILEDKDFVWLETLDLSCNHLTTDDVLALGVLPSLKVLHLTGNQLTELPREMCRSFSLKKGQRHCCFGNLEKLWLDENKLTDITTFTCLAGLKRLQYLNLEKNNITSVPHLRLLEPNPLRSSFSDLTRHMSPNVNEVIHGEIQNVNSKISILEEILYNAKTDGFPDRSDVIEAETSNFSHRLWQDYHVLPFPSLRHLNLANNEIEAEEGLLTLSTWPRLEEVVIWGNPVATYGKRGPPVVTYQLGRVAGIEITRNKPTKEVKNTSYIALGAPPRKIADVPTVSQTRQLLMLEAPEQPELSYNIKPLPPIPSSAGSGFRRVTSAPAMPRGNDVSKDESFEVQRPTKTEGESSCIGDSSFFTPRQDHVPSEERVFLTQAEDAENEQVLFFNNDEETSKEGANLKPNAKPTIPKKYHGYEDLLNIDEQYPEDITLPKGVHGNVRALQYALDHPLTFTERSARYRKKETSKHSQRITGLSSYRSTRPTTVEELGSILDKMRTHTKTVESNLDNVLEGRPKNKKELKEAKRLLNEVQAKYDEVRCESLRSTAVAADVLLRTEAQTPAKQLISKSQRKMHRVNDSGVTKD